MAHQEHITAGEILGVLRATAQRLGIPDTRDTTGNLVLTPRTGPAYRISVESVDQPDTVDTPPHRDLRPGPGPAGMLFKYVAVYADASINAYVSAAFFAPADAPWPDLIYKAEKIAPPSRLAIQATRLAHILPAEGSGRLAYQAW
ncbi:hypothetical protein [Nocardia terpenica]|uniref:Uncharacterized protein n=1 Tax=Nocardia terpenica TaxID=455432 RepID=A0A6G9ZDZ7_9NOCA|nr:hypothetical protein [Nocardia terpenica]QIS23674.1 hypothetical protein F6W96_40780 [Nocardia terpenica]